MKFVHISDLHFNPINDGRTTRDVRDEFISYLKKEKISADELLITGDLRHAKYQGKERSEIDAVVAFIKDIAEAVNISDAKHIHLVPGNHDRDRISDIDDIKRIEKIREQYDCDNGHFEEDDLAFLLQPFDYFRMVCDTLYGADNYWEAGKLHTYRALGGTVFLYLNTAIMHNTDDDRGRLIIGNDCLDRLLREIKTEYPSFPIIVLAHHSPDFFTIPEKHAFEKILGSHEKASLYLCGDAHKPWFRELNRCLEITTGCLKKDKGAEATFLVGDTETKELTAHHWVGEWDFYKAMNTGLERFLPPKRIAGKLPFNNIPYDENPNFTGRTEILKEIKNHLNPGEKKPHSLALHGLGAVGKTEIALEYTLQNGHLYDAIWWVNAENDLAIINSYRGFLQKKGMIQKDAPYKSEEILQLIKGWMKENDNWLFLYDNAESEKDLTPYLPRVNTGHILITTQDWNWRNSKRIWVDVFKPQEAVDFFNRFDLKGSPKDAGDLAKALGYLPLALDQAAAYMLVHNKTYQEYHDLFQKYRLEALEKADYKSADGKTVATTWHMALKKMTMKAPNNCSGFWRF
ncbi:MAG: metallophosphoesterase [Christensenellales bacterium]|jgi:predicted MPP superfamily phosphohydrolase